VVSGYLFKGVSVNIENL